MEQPLNAPPAEIPDGPAARPAVPSKLWSVQTLLACLVFACLFPGVLGAGLLFYHEYRDDRAQQEQDTLQTARALMRAVDGQILRAQAVAQTLSTASSIRRGDFADFLQQAGTVIKLSDAGTNVLLSDGGGQQIVNTLGRWGAPLPLHGSLEEVRRVFASGRPAISDLFTSPLLHRPIMSVDVPVFIDGKVAYVLSIGILADHFNAFLQTQSLPPEWTVAVLDRQGTIVARNHDPERWVGRKATAEFTEKIAKALEGSMETTTLDGIPVMSVFSRSPVTHWSVGIGIPRQSIEASLWHGLSLLGLGMTALFFVALALAWTMGGRIARSVHALTAPALALGNGKAVPVPQVHIREAAEVSQAMGEAAELLLERTTALRESNRSLLKREAELAETHRRALQEIGERRLAQAQLEESRARLEAVLHGLSEGVIVSDQEGNILNMNPEALSIYRYADIAQVPRRLPALSDIFELRRDGVALELEQCPLARVLRGESFIDYELEILHKDTGSSCIINYNGTPVRGKDGKVILGVLTIRDISDRKRAEEKILNLNAELEQRVRRRTTELEHSNEALLRSNMELQRFAHAAAHDLQTPLRAIAGFAQILQQETRDRLDERSRELLTLIVDNARRLHTLIQELLTYARLDTRFHPFEATDLREVFEEIVTILADPIRETGATVTCGDLPVLRADRGQMVQLLRNLIENGIKYRGKDPARVSVNCERRDKEWVFAVADNGIGIDPRYHRRIFEIFRRLHSYGQIPGTGIGLAICQRIVERHGGRIWLESQPGKGSTFYFALPVGTEESDLPRSRPGARPDGS